jgi:hypothetical protein
MSRRLFVEAGVSMTAALTAALLVQVLYRIWKRKRSQNKNVCCTAVPTTQVLLSKELFLEQQREKEILEHYEYHVEELQSGFDLKMNSLNKEHGKIWMSFACATESNVLIGPNILPFFHGARPIRQPTMVTNKKELELVFFLQKCINQPESFLCHTKTHEYQTQQLEKTLFFPKAVCELLSSYCIEKQLEKIYLRPLQIDRST